MKDREEERKDGRWKMEDGMAQWMDGWMDGWCCGLG